MGPRVRLPRRVLTSGELVPCSRAIILGYPPGFVWELALVECPVHYGPGLDGNDPLLSLRLYSFILCVVLVLHSGTSALIWGGVLICSPYYVVGGVSCGMLWDTYCFRVYTLNYTFGIIYLLFFSCNCTQCRGLGTNTCLYFHYCNLILVNFLFRPTA